MNAKFINGWFMKNSAQVTDTSIIKRDNFIEWINWSFFASNIVKKKDVKEINAMIARVQKVSGVILEPGYNPDLTTIRLGYNTVEASHRPFILYACICLLEIGGYCCLQIMGYRYIFNF
jgi:hypothetical protein